MKITPNNITYRHATCEHLTATPDAFAEIDGATVPVEIKFTANDGSEWDDLAAFLDGNLPAPPPATQVEHHWVQHQTQLAVCKAPFGLIVGLIGNRAAVKIESEALNAAREGRAPDFNAVLADGDLRVLKVPRSETMIAKIEREIEAFWRVHVATNTPPTATAQDIDALNRLWAQASGGKVVSLDGAESDVERYEAARQARLDAEKALKPLQEAEDAAKAALLLRMGDAERGVCGKYTVNWSNVEVAPRKGYSYRKFSTSTSKE